MLAVAGLLWGQGRPPPASLVTIPTAGTLQRGQYEFEVLMQTGGSILGRVGVGLSDRFSLGMSYGLQEFIGDQKPSVNKSMPEVQLKYRLYDEGYQIPAIALGLDTQGRGIFYPEGEVFGVDTLSVARYDIKAIGVFLVASKNWNMLGNLGTHVGICKNFLEKDDTDNDINLFFGIDKDINPSISAFIEYNAAFDDNEYSFEEISFGKGRGYLNAGIRFNVATNLYMEIDLNDVLLNKGEVEYFSRELKVVYNEYF
jgi:hypothetical protein